LNHRSNGACVFLSPEGRCRIHERFGSGAKPLACRLYPFILIPAGDHWRIGLRYSCPSVVGNKGRALAEHAGDIREYARLLEKEYGDKALSIEPPRFPGAKLSWQDVLRFVRAFSKILEDDQDTFARRLLKIMALTRLCRQARFENVQGSRLSEFLELMTPALEAECPRNGDGRQIPGHIGRVLFRQAAGVYARRDRGPWRSLETGRLALLRAGWRFARGRGSVPRVHAAIPATTFDRGEKPIGPLGPEVETLLQRYYQTKLESLQFCGAVHFQFDFWVGLEALVLTYPIILWLTRLLDGNSLVDRVGEAISIVDHNYGHNPALGSWRHRLMVRILSQRGDLEKLVCWYSR
jgi:lysine-N-methylase